MISYHRRYQENTTLLNLLKYIFDILMVILTASQERLYLEVLWNLRLITMILCLLINLHMQ